MEGISSAEGRCGLALIEGMGRSNLESRICWFLELMMNVLCNLGIMLGLSVFLALGINL